MTSFRFRKTVYVGLVLWLWVVVVLWTIIAQFGGVDHAQQADVIIVLGAGLKPGNIPPEALLRRVAHGVELWQAGYAPMMICSGGIASPRYTRTEASVCAELLEQAGVAPEAIIQEDTSRSTEENALNSTAIMAGRGWTSAIVVSDQYHMYRAAHLFAAYPVAIYPSGAPQTPDTWETLLSTMREVIALHWQWTKETLNLPYRYVGGL